MAVGVAGRPGVHTRAMRMRFGPDSDDEFHAAARELLDGFAAWLTENEVDAEPMSAELLLQYKWLAADGDLANWPLEHVETFLDGWCPHVVLEHRLPVRLVPASVAAFIKYLDERGLLAPGGPRPSQVRRLCGEYVQEYEELEAGAGSPLLTELGDDPDPVRIPSPADRAASAAQARILHDARALAAWCGDRGRPLTATGNLRLADARELVDLLGTGDEPDRYGRLDRSTRLRTLTWVLETSVRAGAVRREKGRLVAVPRFAGLDDTTAHEDLVLAARDVGALSTGWPRAVVDDGTDPDRPAGSLAHPSLPAPLEDVVLGFDDEDPVPGPGSTTRRSRRCWAPGTARPRRTPPRPCCSCCATSRTASTTTTCATPWTCCSTGPRSSPATPASPRAGRSCCWSSWSGSESSPGPARGPSPTTWSARCGSAGSCS